MVNYVHSRLVNLAHQLSRNLDEPPKRRTTKILILHLQQLKAPKQNLNPLVSAIIANIQDIGKEIATDLSASGTFSPPTSSEFSVTGLTENTGALPNPPS